MSKFIRALWGDPFIHVWPKVLVDVAKTVILNLHPPEIVTYCFGESNRIYLEKLGVPTVMLGMEGVSALGVGQSEERNPNENRNERKRGLVNWGVSSWRHKLLVMQQAVREFGEIIWLDWDCRLVRPIEQPVLIDFWERMGQGQPYQESLMGPLKHRPSHCWRTIAANFIHHGAFKYCRSQKIIDRMVAISDKHPDWDDEIITGRWIEDLWGGWDEKSPQRWIDEGYEPYCYVKRRQFRHGTYDLFTEG